MSIGSIPIVLTRLRFPLAALVVSFHVAACCHPSPPVQFRPHPGCDLKPDTSDRGVHGLESCQAGSCGSNSPYINAFPFNGLHTSACANGDGDVLDDRSLRPDKRACSLSGPLVLTIEEWRGRGTGYQLVVKSKSTPKDMCTGNQLVGTTFDMVSTRQNHRTTLTIIHVGSIPVEYTGARSSRSEEIPAVPSRSRPWA